MILFSLSSCSSDKFGKELLCTSLFSPYTAKLDFIFSSDGKNTIGKATLSKDDTTTVLFSEPDAYNGISIKSDSAGNADILSFEFSGIPAEIPKSIATDISLMFSLFSDIIPSKIKSLDSSSFRESPIKNEEGRNLSEVFFSENEVSYIIVYDSSSGIPHSMDAGNDEVSVSVVFSDLKINKTKK